MKYFIHFCQTITLFYAATVACSANALPFIIDLNDYYSDTAPTVAADGSTATIAEDPYFAPFFLSNDSALVDPGFIIAGIETPLSFDTTFTETAGNDDIFVAFLLDAATGLSMVLTQPQQGAKFSTVTRGGFATKPYNGSTGGTRTLR